MLDFRYHDWRDDDFVTPRHHVCELDRLSDSARMGVVPEDLHRRMVEVRVELALLEALISHEGYWIFYFGRRDEWLFDVELHLREFLQSQSVAMHIDLGATRVYDRAIVVFLIQPAKGYEEDGHEEDDETEDLAGPDQLQT